jgi:hypothetical protein
MPYDPLDCPATHAVLFGNIHQRVPRGALCADCGYLRLGEFCLVAALANMRSATARKTLVLVFAIRSWGNVAWVAARRVIAGVTSKEFPRIFIRNRNGNTVCTVTRAGYLDHTVSLPIPCAGPRPAFIGASPVNLGPEAAQLFFGKWWNWFMLGVGHLISSIDRCLGWGRFQPSSTTLYYPTNHQGIGV